MKNRKSLLGLVLVVMVLVLGVGYAVVSSISLTVSGSAETVTKNLDVVISAASPTSGNTYGTVSNPADKTATITVTGMTGTSDTRTVTYTVQNKETDLDAKVYVDSSSDIVVKNSDNSANSSHFTVTTSITGESNAITVPAGGTRTFTVTVGLSAMPIEGNDSTANITITLTADPAPKASS
jgi:hypothetical protein